jgi:hypothetical protein
MTSSFDDIEIDLTEARRAANEVRGLLLALRSSHDLRPYEYAARVRIAPGKVPHSHPVLTLNTMRREEGPLLSLYIHEQMHWYVTWYSHARAEGWRAIQAVLERRYPTLPTTFPEGARTAASSQLHLIVNWLEVEIVAGILGREAAVRLASGNFLYSGIYRMVLADWGPLSALYRLHGLTPVRSALDMTEQDLALAARMDEASVDER